MSLTHTIARLAEIPPDLPGEETYRRQVVIAFDVYIAQMLSCVQAREALEALSEIGLTATAEVLGCLLLES